MSQDEPCPVNPNILGGGGARASLGQSLPSAETSTVTQADSQDNVVGFPSAVPLPWSLVALSLLSHPPPRPGPLWFPVHPPLGWTAAGLMFCQLWPPLQGRPVCCLGWWALALTDRAGTKLDHVKAQTTSRPLYCPRNTNRVGVPDKGP